MATEVLSMYTVSVPVLERALRSLSHVLERGAEHAGAHSIDPAVLLAGRLAPDMLPLNRQIHIATDIAKGCAARLAGLEPPVYEDVEVTFADLQARITRTLDYIAGIDPAAIDGAESRVVTVRLGGEPREFTGLQYLNYFVIPNVFFHCTTAYAILRHNGVELKKVDFLGQP